MMGRTSVKVLTHAYGRVRLKRSHLLTAMLSNSRWEDWLPTIESGSVDLVLIDPPYGISRDTRFTEGKHPRNLSYNFGEWDEPVSELLYEECYRVLRNGGTLLTFCDLWNIPELPMFGIKRFGEWIKTNPAPINQKKGYLSNAREVFVTAVKGHNPTFNSTYDDGIYKYPICKDKGRFHPTQKPIALIEELVLKHSNEGDLVLDCFSGSGTTMVACQNLGRRFVGCEMNEEYYKKSLLRLEGCA